MVWCKLLLCLSLSAVNMGCVAEPKDYITDFQHRITNLESSKDERAAELYLRLKDISRSMTEEILEEVKLMLKQQIMEELLPLKLTIGVKDQQSVTKDLLVNANLQKIRKDMVKLQCEVGPVGPKGEVGEIGLPGLPGSCCIHGPFGPQCNNGPVGPPAVTESTTADVTTGSDTTVEMDVTEDTTTEIPTTVATIQDGPCDDLRDLDTVIINSTYNIQRDTTLQDVTIYCAVSPTCITVQPGVQLNIIHSCITGNNDGRFIKLLGGAHLMMHNVHISQFDITYASHREWGVYQLGGGVVFAVEDNTVTITDSTIHNNTASMGGVVSMRSGGVLTIAHSQLTHNHASFAGGAVSMSESRATLEEVEITGNTGWSGGGGMRIVYSEVNITNSNISHNSAGKYAGGLQLEYDWSRRAPRYSELSSEVNIYNSTVASNNSGSNPDNSGDISCVTSRTQNITINVHNTTITNIMNISPDNCNIIHN